MSADTLHAQLLQSIVDSARAIFAANAASIMLYDRAAHELVFETVSGEGQGRIIGHRLPASSGIAGWVLTSGEAIIVEDVNHDPRFARAVAERTGYVPTMLMSAPLLDRGEPMGVLNILDRTRSEFAAAGEMQLLGMFANHASIALAVVLHARGKHPDEPAKREAAVQLREAADAFLRTYEP